MALSTTWNLQDNIYANKSIKSFAVFRRKCLKCDKKLGIGQDKECCGHTYTEDSLTRLEIVNVIADSYEKAVLIAN